MYNTNISEIIEKAEKGIISYLNESKEGGRIDEQLYRDAISNTFPNLKKWMTDPNIDTISPSLKEGIINAVKDEKWEDIVNAFRQNVRFGTGGIRGMMAFDRDSIILMKDAGLDAPFLKGPNTINNLVLLITSAGVARFGKDRGFEKIVIGYDSRVRGFDLASLAAQLFLAYDYTVYFFDAPCPYPEVTYAIPSETIRADVGILISASHNDYRYNGYKLSCSNGSQFDTEDRNEMYSKYIEAAKTDDIKLCSFEDASAEKLWFLGGDFLLEEFNYAGKEKNLINMHEKHRNHVKSFLLTEDLADRQAKSSDPLNIGFCAFHGAGNIAVPRLLKDVGFKEILAVTKNGLNECNGLFPQFNSDPGLEQQPDPGAPKAAAIAVNAFRDDHPGKFDEMDILIGTDPDADRCGVVVKVPENQRFLFNDQDWALLPADDLWALVIWYRLNREKGDGNVIPDADKKFVTLSHTTSDSITRLALKYGLGVMKTWVGFSALASATGDIWDGNYTKYTHLVDGRYSGSKFVPDNFDLCDEIVCQSYAMDNGKRSINVAAMEQSNGFSILGGPPPDLSSLGENGHVRDKDGTFAALLVAEIAAWAKENNTTLFELIDEHIYLDPDVGLFVTGYQPDPVDGEYPGIEGDRLKKAILRRALGYFQMALAGDLEIAGLPVKSATIYRTGKYDAIYAPTYDFEFPDEGVRFFFDDTKLSHVTIRPSGTGNSLRLHTQLHAEVTRSDLVKKKYELRYLTDQIFKDIRSKLKAPEWKLFLG